MPPDNLVECFLQGRNVELTGQSYRLRQVVKRHLRLKLVQEPKPLLGERERQVWIVRIASGWPGNSRAGIRTACGYGRRKLCKRWSFEQVRERQIKVEHVAQPAHDLHGMQ